MYGWFGAGQLMIRAEPSRAAIDSVIEFDLKHHPSRDGELKFIAAILAPGCNRASSPPRTSGDTASSALPKTVEQC